MPLILNKVTQGGMIIGLWETRETAEMLLQRVQTGAADMGFYANLKSEHRKLEWLAVRALLKEISGSMGVAAKSGGVPKIIYSANGQPHLEGSSAGLSVSHSGPYAAIALHPSGIPGIDVEQIHPRLNNIAMRFLHASEKDFLDHRLLLEMLCVIWCCKETLYKVHSAERRLNFKENIIVSPFRFQSEGGVTCRTVTGSFSAEYRLSYSKIDNYILVHT